jgi:hypothetical protein
MQTRHALRQTPALETLEARTLLSTCHVTRVTDEGIGKGFRGDLRYCITKTNQLPGPDAIDFNVYGSIYLQSPLPAITSEMDIHGPGQNLIAIRGTPNSHGRPIFQVAAGATLRIAKLSVRNGVAAEGSATLPAGGAIFNAGTLILENVRVADSTALGSVYPAQGGGIYNRGYLTVRYSQIHSNLSRQIGAGANAFGGGVFNDGTMTVQHSTIHGNSTDSQVGLSEGAGVFNRGTLTIMSSTITGNAPYSSDFGRYGGGIRNETPGQLFILHSTIARNYADVGGGIFGDIHEMRNSIVAINNVTETGTDLWGEIETSGYNLIGDSVGGAGYVPTDILDVDPKLGPFDANGGPTFTIDLLPDSPAIDAGDNTDAPEWDQRGPGFPRIVNDTIDIGAFEVQATAGPSPLRTLTRIDSLTLTLTTADMDTLP